MRKWIEASDDDCRRVVERKYFNCPEGGPPLTVPCCDICVLKKARESPGELTPQENKILKLLDRLRTRTIATTDVQMAAVPETADVEMADGDNAGERVPCESEKENQPIGTKRPRGVGDRRSDRLESCRQALLDWRNNI